jgi:glycosyltransferase involved in cell wall biosynthesis
VKKNISSGAAMRGIGVALMTHNETTQFDWLMAALTPAFDVIDEIVVVDDFSNADCVAAIRAFEGKVPLRFHQRALNKNFARQRNYVKSLCRGRLIFFPDPDELPPKRIVLGLPKILAMMERLDVDACTLPRLNVLYERSRPVHPTAIDLTGAGVLRYFCEDQIRVLRNLPHLQWRLRVDEELAHIRRGYRFPRGAEYALLHCKTVKAAAEAQAFYRSIRLRHVSRIRKAIARHLPWRQRTEWLEVEAPA